MKLELLLLSNHQVNPASCSVLPWQRTGSGLVRNGGWVYPYHKIHSNKYKAHFVPYFCLVSNQQYLPTISIHPIHSSWCSRC